MRSQVNLFSSIQDFKVQFEADFLTLAKNFSDSRGGSDFSSAFMYPLKSGGKRVRPLLFYSMMDAYLVGGLNRELYLKYLPLASAIEWIHSYSLVHDDLPSMDNDDLRRGLPTLHKVVSEGRAILIGDALLNSAFELCAAFDSKLWDPLAVCAGSHGMILGQWYDMDFQEGKRTSFEDFMMMLDLKTAHLFKAAVVSAFRSSIVENSGYLGNSLDKNLDKNLDGEIFLRDWAQNSGIYFQLQDDCMDAVGTKEISNSVKLFGLDRVKAEMGEVQVKARTGLNKIEFEKGTARSQLLRQWFESIESRRE